MTLRNRALLVIVLTGALLRIGYFLLDRHLWIDEAAVALNLLDKSAGDLVSAPLDHDQHAPPLYLLLEKAALAAMSGAKIEYVLRLQSLLASLAALLLFARLAREQLGPRPSYIACLLFAVSPPLIEYAAEVKPYAGDVLGCVILLTLGLRLHEKREWSLLSLVNFSLAGSILALYSFPAAFVLAVMGSCLIVSEWRAGRMNLAVRAFVVAGVWGLVFLTYLLLLGKHSLGNKDLLEFWSIGFIPFPPHSFSEARSAAWLVAELLQAPVGLRGWELPGLLLLIGLLSLRLQNAFLFATIGGLLVLVAVASVVHLYPISTRLVLFVAPLTIIAMAAGLDVALLPLGHDRLATHLAVGILVVGQLLILGKSFSDPRRTGLPKVFAALSERSQEGDFVYLYHRVGVSYQFYARTLRLPDRRVIQGSDYREDWKKYQADIAGLHGRVWFVFSDVRASSMDEKEAILLMAGARGKHLQTVTAGGACAELLDLQ